MNDTEIIAGANAGPMTLTFVRAMFNASSLSMMTALEVALVVRVSMLARACMTTDTTLSSWEAFVVAASTNRDLSLALRHCLFALSITR